MIALSHEVFSNGGTLTSPLCLGQNGRAHCMPTTNPAASPQALRVWRAPLREPLQSDQKRCATRQDTAVRHAYRVSVELSGFPGITLQAEKRGPGAPGSKESALLNFMITMVMASSHVKNRIKACLNPISAVFRGDYRTISLCESKATRPACHCSSTRAFSGQLAQKLN